MKRFFSTFTNKVEYMGTQYLGFFKVNMGNPLFGESIENMCYLFGIWGYGHIMSYHDIKVNTIGPIGMQWDRPDHNWI